ncbi:hypothetical protein QCA50_005999 [Cerrena zonata]|uniref:Protein kinase domain-containing protein n=1 Tax=Cerrena zonata TaxID=2478898 RepID=A0AAW0GLV2_9APHY
MELDPTSSTDPGDHSDGITTTSVGSLDTVVSSGSTGNLSPLSPATQVLARQHDPECSYRSNNLDSVSNDHDTSINKEEYHEETQRYKPDPSSSQQDLDQLFQAHLDSIAAKSISGTVDIRTSESFSTLRGRCNLLDRLPSALYLGDVNVPREPGWLPQVVGGGSFSDVYKARKGDLEVAVKVLRIYQSSDEIQRRKLRKRFISEALIWVSCDYEYVLPFLGVDTINFPHGMCIVLPWMEHGNVAYKFRSLREEKSPKGCERQVDIWILQISKGLAYLHSLGIVHGDLRAANVLLDENYNIKLADFGLSLVVDDVVTQATTIERTHNWIAPELLIPEEFGGTSSKPTLAGDVYAFGCVAIELYTGKPPYLGLTLYQVHHKVLTAETIPMPDFYDEPGGMDYYMWWIIEKCLSRDSTQRRHAPEIPGLLESVLFDIYSLPTLLSHLNL